MAMITATVSGSLIFLAIPVSQLWDFIFFNKTYTVFELIGTVLIFGTNIVLSLYKGFWAK